MDPSQPAQPSQPLQQTPVRRRKRRLTVYLRRQQLAAAERRAKVWGFKTKGFSCEAIARQLGCSAMQVSRDYRRSLAAYQAQEQVLSEAHRVRELADLNDMEASLAPARAKGVVPAVRESRKVSESRRRLLGLDMPVKTEITGPGGGPVQTVALDQLDVRGLLERLGALTADVVRLEPPRAAVPSQAPEPDDLTQRAAAYEQQLLARKGNGHGGNGRA